MFFAWWLHYRGWLSCSLSRPCQSNSDIIIAWDHLKLVEGGTPFIWIQPYLIWRSITPHSSVWSFQLDQSKLLKQRCKLMNDVSFTLSSLSLKFAWVDWSFDWLHSSWTLTHFDNVITDELSLHSSFFFS